MYIPTSFVETDPDVLHSFIDAHGFATLITGGEALSASHVPLLLDRDASPGRLLGHVAKANPQWRQADGAAALAIFHGPHAYISPAWYEAQNVVPTWNYVAVHVHGTIALLEDRQDRLEIVRRFVDDYESPRDNPWSLDSVDEDLIDKLLDAIVAFEIRIERIDGAWKLNQNHPPERRRRVIRELQKIGGDDCDAIARLMTDTLQEPLE